MALTRDGDWDSYFNIRLPIRSIDYTSKDYESFRRMMIQGLEEFMPEYTDTSQTDAGIVLLEQIARGMDILSFHQDVYANEAFFLSSRDRETAVRWARGLGYHPSNRTAAVHSQVFELARVADTDMVIPRGTQVKTQQSALESEIVFETVEDLVIPPGHSGNERDPDDPRRYLFTVPVRQGRTINEERVGSSNGLPNQRFALNNRNAIVDTLRVFVNEGGGFIRWERVRSFIDSARDDRHYMVEVDEFDNTTLIFGDNFAGRIPNPLVSGIFATYAVGGGTIGNVPPRTITVMGTSISYVRSTFNPYSDFVPGADKESLVEIKRNAPAHLRTLWRSVTLQDHADLALIHFPQIRFANAIQCPVDRNDALLFILMQGGIPFQPNSPFHHELLRFYDRRSMIGNSTHIFPARFMPIDLTADLHVRSDFVLADVKKNVENAVNHFFSIGNYDFDTEFVYSDFEAVINKMDGVRSFRITVTDPIDKVIPRPEEILVLNGLEMRAFGGVME